MEVAKLLVAAVTPLVVVFLGIRVSRAARRVEDAQWTNRKLLERRLTLYDEMAPGINDLVCFFRCVGDFQKITPPNALARKRELDRLFYLNEFLMSEEFRTAYRSFISACFLMYTGAGQPAQLRASARKQREERRGQWQDEWRSYLVDSDASVMGLSEIGQRHRELMSCFARDIGVELRRDGVGGVRAKLGSLLRPGRLRSAARS